MDQKQSAKRTCPECGSEKYLFRGRKKIPTEPGTEGEIMETKYRGAVCEHAWKERVSVKEQA